MQTFLHQSNVITESLHKVLSTSRLGKSSLTELPCRVKYSVQSYLSESVGLACSHY